MDGLSKPMHGNARKSLRIEELEERIAPFIVSSGSGFVRGEYLAANGVDEYWIFYVGPGQADIRAADGSAILDPAELDEKDIGEITITGSTMDSGLYIMDYPQDRTASQETFPGIVAAGTLMFEGDITVMGDIGYIGLDGIFWGDPSDAMDLQVTGNLGKLDVGALIGNVYVTGDIYEIAIDSTMGVLWYPPGPGYSWYDDTSIQAEGDIGAIRIGVGLTDQGQSVNGTSILGGVIGGGCYIRANADSSADPGTIDLIEVLSGSVPYWDGTGGSLGIWVGDTLPRLSAGPGGNIRFLSIDGYAYVVGPQGASTAISPLTVDASSPLIDRTIVDDGGGVMVILPQETQQGEQGVVGEFISAAQYLIIPVDKVTQGPGSVIARILVAGANTFNVRGNVDIGHLDIVGGVEDGVALAQELASLQVASLSEVLALEGTLTGLAGIAHETISGPGECDVYRLTSAGTMPIVVNNTQDGDIVSVQSTGIIYSLTASRQGGDIGAGDSITPYLLKGPLHWADGDVAWVDTADAEADQTNPYGIEGSITRYNAICGVLSEGGIYELRAGGAIGDVRAPRGGSDLIVANTNNVRDPGSSFGLEPNIIYLPWNILGPGFHSYHDSSVSWFGKISNEVGDGIFGQVFSGTGQDFPDSHGGGVAGGGYIWQVRCGEGLTDTVRDLSNWYPIDSPFPNDSGVFISSGIYTSDYIYDVTVSGSGRGIYGDIVAEANNLAGIGVWNVRATDGAVIENNVIASATVDIAYSAFGEGGYLHMVSASGNGAKISNVFVYGTEIGSVTASGGHGSDGIANCYIWASTGGFTKIRAEGKGIVGTAVWALGPSGSIQSTDPDGAISNCEIEILSGLKYLETHSLLNDTIFVSTLGKLSTLYDVTGTTFEAGGLRNINVKHDITNSTLRVAGPFDNLKVGNNVTNSTIESTGFFGTIGTIDVKGSIIGSDILSWGSIKSIKTSTGGIDADIVAIGTEGKLSVDSAGTVSGTWQLAHRLENLKVKNGNVDADIDALSVGKIFASANITGTLNIAGNVGSVTAEGNVTSDISAGGDLGSLVSNGGSITGSVSVTGDAKSILAAVNIGRDTTTINVGGNLGTLAAGSRGIYGDVLCDVAVTGALKTLAVTGNVTGDLNIGGNFGSAKIGGALGGSVDVGGNLGSMKTGGNVGSAITHFNVVGNLATLAAGTSGATAQVFCDVNVGGNLGTLNVTGDFPASLSVGGKASAVKVGGDAGGVGDTFNVNGKLGTLQVGYLSLADLFASVTVSGDVSALKVSGDVYDDVNVTGKVGNIQTGRILSDITIAGDLTKIVSGSVFVPAAPGEEPVDYWIYNSGIRTGQLVVGGVIKNAPM